MNPVRVTIFRDAEDEAQHWWLAQVTFGGREHVTQGETIDGARFMAADLLKMLGASDDTVIAFDVREQCTIRDLLERAAATRS